MKKVIFLLCLIPFMSFAQNIKVSGIIKDSDKLPIAFADVKLLNSLDSLVYRNTTADNMGLFKFENVAKGEYILKISASGYTAYYTDFTLNKDKEFAGIAMIKKAEALDDVVITNKKPVIKRKIDRIEFNVENSVLSNTNAWEILKSTPGVTASNNGTIAVRGSSGILVTINDKKVYLSGEELKQLLENTNGDTVKSVEVITNPPAKYDAQGSTVLNIKIKQNNQNGYKGTLSTAYVQTAYPKGVMSTSQYYKTKKLALSGNYSFGTGIYYREGADIVYYKDNQDQVTSIWESILNRKNKSLSQNTYRLTAEYEIDSLNTLTLGTNGFISLNNHGEYNVPTYIYDANRQIDSLYTTQNKRKNPTRTNAYNASFEHKFSEKQSIVISSDYTKYFKNENQDIYSVFSLPQSGPYRDTRFVSDNTQKIGLFSIQADYNNEIGEAKIEAGIKFGNVNANSNLDYRDDIAGELQLNPNRSSQFLYDENIYAGYLSLSKEIGKWSLKAGLRSEYTELEGNLLTSNEVNTQHYFKLFPTLYALYKLTEAHEIGISYGKRINRPQYSALNPFRSYYNSYSYYTGDPKLQPEIVHNISLQYTLKSKYNFDLYYRNSIDPSMEISFQDYETNTVIYRHTNIERKIGYGLDFSANQEIFPWWQFIFSNGISYSKDTFQGGDGNLYHNNIWSYNNNINNRFTLNKKKELSMELNWSYDSPSVQGTFTVTGSSSLSIGIYKKVFNNNGQVAILFSDIYKGQKVRVTTNYANQYNYFDDYGDTQSVRISFKYNLGNQKLKNKNNKEKTEEQQRL